jgi:hypothetical protein
MIAANRYTVCNLPEKNHNEYTTLQLKKRASQLEKEHYELQGEGKKSNKLLFIDISTFFYTVGTTVFSNTLFYMFTLM